MTKKTQKKSPKQALTEQGERLRAAKAAKAAKATQPRKPKAKAPATNPAPGVTPAPAVEPQGTVRADHAQPGWYRSRKGTLIQVVDRDDATLRAGWQKPPKPDAVPYAIRPQSEKEAAVRSWLAADYPLSRAEKPPGQKAAKGERRQSRREAGPRTNGIALASGTVLRRAPTRKHAEEVVVRVVEATFVVEAPAAHAGTFPSLSAVARLFGARNAGLFFGLRKREGKADSVAA